ncbi:MAG: hypothetical protein KDA36_09735 [Planctomycetaceae bacterium]|nr:hypothetical protein [Planctomycetaceae bacterium]
MNDWHAAGFWDDFSMIKRLNRAVVTTTIYSNLLYEVLSIAEKISSKPS